MYTIHARAQRRLENYTKGSGGKLPPFCARRGDFTTNKGDIPNSRFRSCIKIGCIKDHSLVGLDNKIRFYRG